MFMGQKKIDEANEAKAAAKSLSESIPSLQHRERELEAKLEDIELAFPNMPHESVPDGDNEDSNLLVREWVFKAARLRAPLGASRAASALSIRLGGQRLREAGFPIYSWPRREAPTGTGNLSMLEFQLEKHGYREIYPPYLVNRASLIGTGTLPKFEEELYKTSDDLYLIPNRRSADHELFSETRSLTQARCRYALPDSAPVFGAKQAPAAKIRVAFSAFISSIKSKWSGSPSSKTATRT